MPFLCLILAVFVLLKQTPARIVAKHWLLIGSLVFCGFSGAVSLGVLVGSVTANYLTASFLAGDSDAGRRRAAFIAGVSMNLMLLIGFKYTNFLLITWGELVNIPIDPVVAAWPLGLSFYTLTQIMFLVDVYQRTIAGPTFVDYALFVTFFPAISAGPICKHRDTYKEIHELSKGDFCIDNVARGLTLFVLGLFQKTVIADSLGLLVATGYGVPGPLGLCEAWLISTAFTVQLYFDFCGYSDMAKGLGWMFGLNLPWNFDSPLQSKSIIEFWTRWHMSLSHFIFTYLYYPILRTYGRPSHAQAMRATFLVMVLVGFWHGPAWNYVIFGALHGLALVCNHTFRKKKKRMPAVLGLVFTLIFVNWSFVFFRAPAVPQAASITCSMLGLNGLRGLENLAEVERFDRNLCLLLLAFGAGYALLGKSSKTLFSKFAPSYWWLVATSLLLCCAWFFMNSHLSRSFLYVDF